MLRLERPDFISEKPDLRPKRPDLRPENPDLRPERPDWGDKLTDKQMSPWILQDLVPFGAAAQKEACCLWVSVAKHIYICFMPPKSYQTALSDLKSAFSDLKSDLKSTLPGLKSANSEHKIHSFRPNIRLLKPEVSNQPCKFSIQASLASNLGYQTCNWP